MAAQDKASKPPSAPKIVPALPILPPQATKKENVPPPKDSEPKLDATVPQEKPEAPVIESMARLEIGSATPQIPAVKASIPVYGVTGDHAGFMREALDMVRPSRYFSFGFILPSVSTLASPASSPNPPRGFDHMVGRRSEFTAALLGMVALVVVPKPQANFMPICQGTTGYFWAVCSCGSVQPTVDLNNIYNKKKTSEC